jgi:hypothetical protein
MFAEGFTAGYDLAKREPSARRTSTSTSRSSQTRLLAEPIGPWRFAFYLITPWHARPTILSTGASQDCSGPGSTLSSCLER